MTFKLTQKPNKHITHEDCESYDIHYNMRPIYDCASYIFQRRWGPTQIILKKLYIYISVLLMQSNIFVSDIE
jgi:hypothetical protein